MPSLPGTGSGAGSALTTYFTIGKDISSLITNPFQRDPVGAAVPIPELCPVSTETVLAGLRGAKSCLLHTSHSFGTRENVAATSFSGYMAHA